ncbi:MAG: hypothetical protein U0176_02275 [Bacteroidia bacterium]
MDFQRTRTCWWSRLSLVSVALFCCLSGWQELEAQTGYVWLRSIEGPSYIESGNDVACGPDGRVYLSGDYDDGALFNGVAYNSVGVSDMFTCRYDAAGIMEWVHVEGSPGTDRTFGVRIGADDHTYCAGYGLVGFPANRETLHAWDAITMRLRPDGSLHWGRSLNGASSPDFSEGKDIAVDVHGNSHTVGVMRNDGWYGTDTIQGIGLEDAFISKFDSVGDLQWAFSMGGSQNDYANGVDVGSDGSVWVGGGFMGTANFGGSALVSAGATDGFIAKMDANGNVLFARRIYGSGDAEIFRLKVSADGDCYFVGNFSGTIAVGSTNLTASDTLDIFYGKMDAAGNFLWAYKAGGFDLDFIQDLEIDSEENLYVAGFFFGNFTWGQTITSQGYDDMYWAKVDSNGSLILLEHSGDMYSLDAFGIAVDPAQNVLVTGLFSDTLRLGTFTEVTYLGTIDLFLAKYATRQPELAILSVIGTPYCTADQFQVDFQAWGYFQPGNIFSLELSDANGSFTSPTVIGTLPSQLGGTILGTVPPGIVSGNNYRVRIHASQPNAISPDNGYGIVLYPTTAVPVEILGDTVICNGQPVVLTLDSVFTQVNWSTGDTGYSIVVSQAGLIWVEATDSNGCSNRDEVLVIECVGMDDPLSSEGRLLVWPNPVSSFSGASTVHLQGEGIPAGNYLLRCSDAIGRIVLEANVPSAGKQFSFDFSADHWPPGLYQILLSNTYGGSYQARLIVR